jgi:Spx/MgsR family transcriptional regulator
MTEVITLYGIPNCDTTKKARRWLEERGLAYRFHDYKQQGLDEATLRAWVEGLGWEVLLNRRGTTWRRVPDEVKAGIDRESAIRLMLSTPSIIKRPVLDTGNARCVGFQEADYDRLCARRPEVSGHRDNLA